MRKFALGAVSSVAAVCALAMLAIYLFGAFGIGSERLRASAETALERFAGIDMNATLGATRITFDPSRLLALEVNDVGLRRADNGALVAEAEAVRFGIRILPLLSGDIKLSSVELSGARVAPILPAGNGGDVLAPLLNKDGLIDPDLLAGAVFAMAGGAIDAIDSSSTTRIALSDVDVELPPGAGLAGLHIVELALSQDDADSLSLDAQFEVANRPVSLSAAALRDRRSKRITALNVGITGAAPELPEGAASLPPPAGHRLGAFEVTLSGAEGEGVGQGRLNATMSLGDAALDLGARGILAADLDVSATLACGSNKLDVESVHATIGRSVFDFSGAIGPRPASGEPGEVPAYRFDLISAKSTIAPEESPEPALAAYVRLTGTYEVPARLITANEIVVKSGPGEVLGTASVRFMPDRAPGFVTAFSVRDMPTSHVKQLWPWFTAKGARNWVLDNLFGGRVAEGRVQFQAEPGRLGNGVPLSATEVSGKFSIEGTRFNTTGLIPPVRDAVGTVEFQGNDIDIALSAGTVFLPSGRTVAASNGKLTIEKANLPPVVGALDMDVSGDAAAVMELASYDPINAMRFVGMAPEDFSGEVSGNVKADIPLQRGIKSDTLKWLVALNYRNLSIAKPLDGQMVTEAVGSIVVEPEKAVIAAKAKLSGVAAEIDTVEPLRASGPERKRIISLTLDDKARDTLVPGISDMVQGPVKVKLDARGKGVQAVDVDLTGASLDIPWIGWTKGPGVAAQSTFTLQIGDGKATLSDFNLSGKTFGVKGDVTVANGGLSSAVFSSIRFNRDDDVAVTVKRVGRGFAVDVRGAALDARSVVKRFLSNTASQDRSDDKGSVTINASVKALTGFHGERLSDVALTYSGAGGRVDKMEVSAVTSSGKTVELHNGGEGDGRAIRMQSADAGALLRFLDIYENMEGGTISLSLKGGARGALAGQVDARDFWLVNEPRLGSLVSSRAPGDSMSLNEAVKRDIDTSRVKFERGATRIETDAGYLKLSSGVLRGPLIGMTFQGTLYDRAGNMNMTGTFMPAYGLNRIFGEIPIIGLLLGNGRDRGLIGVTFRLEGKSGSPTLQVNPLSVIAPGIFRSIFEFR